MDINFYQEKLALFARERNWEQFHSPKNLSMALAGECGELLDIFQWLTQEESMRENLDEETLSLVKEELADVFIYMLRLADKLKIDLEQIVKTKIQTNESKYPVHLAKDNATKYNRRLS